MNEVLKLEKADNIDELMALYEEIIEKTSNMEVYGRWKKNLYPTKEDIQAYMDTDSMYKAYEGNQVVGAIGITFFQNEGYTNIRWRKDTTNVCVFHVLGVHPQYQKKGVAKKIVESAIQLAISQNVEAIRLDALASNLPAHRVYESLGFVYCDKKQLYAPNTGWTEFYFYEKAI